MHSCAAWHANTKISIYIYINYIYIYTICKYRIYNFQISPEPATSRPLPYKAYGMEGRAPSWRLLNRFFAKFSRHTLRRGARAHRPPTLAPIPTRDPPPQSPQVWPPKPTDNIPKMVPERQNTIEHSCKTNKSPSTSSSSPAVAATSLVAPAALLTPTSAFISQRPS